MQSGEAAEKNSPGSERRKVQSLRARMLVYLTSHSRFKKTPHGNTDLHTTSAGSEQFALPVQPPRPPAPTHPPRPARPQNLHRKGYKPRSRPHPPHCGCFPPKVPDTPNLQPLPQEICRFSFIVFDIDDFTARPRPGPRRPRRLEGFPATFPPTCREKRNLGAVKVVPLEGGAAKAGTDTLPSHHQLFFALGRGTEGLERHTGQTWVVKRLPGAAWQIEPKFDGYT